MIFHYRESDDGRIYHITSQCWFQDGSVPKVVFDPVSWKPLAFWMNEVLHPIVLDDE